MALPTFVINRRSAGRWTWLIGRLVTAIALIVALLLVLVDRTRPDLTAGMRGAALDMLAPALEMVAAPAKALTSARDWVQSYLMVRQENADLREQIAQLRLLAERTEATERDTATLRGLLRLSEPGTRIVATARVVGASGASMLDSAILTVGSDHGLRPDMPVRDAYGVVGRVVAVGQHAARVLLVTDVESRIPVRVLRTGETAIATGTGTGALELQFLRPDAVLKVGDKVLTSGHGRLFPPNIPVGIVTQIRTSRPQLAPAAGLSRLSHAVVLEPFEQNSFLLETPPPAAP
jgi:rod shape-determining protein MreC